MKKKTAAFHVSRAEFARLIRSSPDRVSRFISEGMPVISTGSGRGRKTILSLSAALPWLLARKTGSLDQARTRLASAQAEKTERENQVRRGELVNIETVQQDFFTCATNTKHRLRRIPDAIATRVVAESVHGPAAVKRLLLAELDAALLELSRGPVTEAPCEQTS